MPLGSIAHHSVAINFERGEPIEIRGTVKEVHMRNPHSQYVVDVPGENGTVAEWFVEWSDRNSLVRRGVDLDLIKPGDTVTMTLWSTERPSPSRSNLGAKKRRATRRNETRHERAATGHGHDRMRVRNHSARGNASRS
jgi:hypothetical protein